MAQLRERMAADWVDLDGFLVADAPDGDGLIGSCWTKVHRASTPVLGEIYVISVDPRFHGQGWGRSLTVAGLVSLAARGVPVGMLYTDATNESAVTLYRSLGFSIDHIDRSYRSRPGRLSGDGRRRAQFDARSRWPARRRRSPPAATAVTASWRERRAPRPRSVKRASTTPTTSEATRAQHNRQHDGRRARREQPR